MAEALVVHPGGMRIVYRVKTFNLNSDEWDGTRDRDGWRVKGTLVGQRIGGELIGATLSEIEPGSRLWPYHTHYLNEEWVIVLRGEPTLRTPEGEHVSPRSFWRGRWLWHDPPRDWVRCERLLGADRV